MSAQDQIYKIYHSDLYLNEIGTTWEISESNDVTTDTFLSAINTLIGITSLIFQYAQLRST